MLRFMKILPVFIGFFFLFFLLVNKTYAADKRIEVNLTTQHLYAFEGTQQIYDFVISSGKWYPTPVGTFYPWVKYRFTGMSGGNQTLGTYYNLPNVPYVVFFYNDVYGKGAGYSLHGTYWHNNFGHPMSHGCVNMKTDDAQKIFYWIDLPNGNDKGTPIIIYGITPEN